MTPDVVSVIEAGYAVELPDEQWVAQICSRAAAAFRIPNAFCYLYDASGPALAVGAAAAVSESAAFRHAVEQRTAEYSRWLPRAIVTALYTPAPRVALASDVSSFDQVTSAQMWNTMRTQLGIDAQDALAIRGGGVDLRGVILGFTFTGDRDPGPGGGISSHFPRGQRMSLERVGAHLAAAYRLRLASRDPEAAAAVLNASGRLLHAGDAEAIQGQPKLTEAVARMKHARRPDTRADDGVAAWQALVDGRWSVIDHVDTDGKRMILARRNEPLDRDLLAICDSDRQVLALASLGYPNKQIAYELGVSAGAVTVRLRRGLKSIGLRSRQELIALRALETGAKVEQRGGRGK